MRNVSALLLWCTMYTFPVLWSCSSSNCSLEPYFQSTVTSQPAPLPTETELERSFQAPFAGPWCLSELKGTSLPQAGIGCALEPRRVAAARLQLRARAAARASAASAASVSVSSEVWDCRQLARQFESQRWGSNVTRATCNALICRRRDSARWRCKPPSVSLASHLPPQGRRPRQSCGQGLEAVGGHE